MRDRTLRAPGRNRWSGGPRIRVVAAAAAAACALGLALAPPAAAAPPTNDDLAYAAPLNVPGTATATGFDEASTQLDEPQCGWYGGSTVWYAVVAPTDEQVRFRSNASWPTALALYTASSSSDLTTLTSLACDSADVPLVVPLTEGATYYLQVTQSPWNATPVDLVVAPVVAPPNDDFADAAAVGLDSPVSASTTDATNEPDEPACGWWNGPSVWFSFTAPESKAYVASTAGAGYVSIWTGSGFPLTNIACNSYGIAATAGGTYWIQASNMPDWAQLTVSLAPPPTPEVFLYTSSPMAGAPVQFGASGTGDPAGVSSTTVAWDFGDGSSTPGDAWGATHTYVKDGDYLVTVTSTTSDGRSGSGTLPVQVRTHDVSVVSFTAPANARAGQSKTFVAGLRNTRYPEAAQVALLRGGPSGWVEVTRISVSLPVKAVNKTTSINLPYVFTAADAKAGLVSFKVQVSLNGPELQTTDNEMVCPPVRVAK